MDADYGDQNYSPALSITGEELPSAYDVSVETTDSDVIEDLELSLFNAPFGQLIAHDMSSANGAGKASMYNNFYQIVVQ